MFSNAILCRFCVSNKLLNSKILQTCISVDNSFIRTYEVLGQRYREQANIMENRKQSEHTHNKRIDFDCISDERVGSGTSKYKNERSYSSDRLQSPHSRADREKSSNDQYRSPTASSRSCDERVQSRHQDDGWVQSRRSGTGDSRNEFKKSCSFEDDSAVLFVGGTIKSSQHDTRETRFRYKKDSYYRRSVPYSSTLLENSYSMTVTQKRSTHSSSQSYQKAPLRQPREYNEENIDPSRYCQIEPHNYGVDRQWELTRLGTDQIRRPRPGFEFFIMSYNILAQNLLEDNMFLYRGCPREVLNWRNRSEKLLEEMNLLKADILCLQEVNQTHYDDFLRPELIKLGYHGVYVKRTGNKKDGCATFYKTDKFSLEESVSVPYYKSHCTLLDRDNVGLIVRLKPHKRHCSEADSICVANTHLLFNPRRGDIKLAQSMCLLAEVDRMSKISNDGRCQIIVCGDFNATPFSDLYKFLTQGYLRYEGLLTRTISGQKDGRHGKNNYLAMDFFPPNHNISDQCQYIASHEKADVNKPRRHEKLGHYLSPFISQSSGCIWHHLNLVSTYRHTIERFGHQEREVTTQHNADSCTVDYIVYGVADKTVHTRRQKYSTSDIVEGKLKLLGRWGLMSSKEVKEQGNLPNLTHPSDHLPLLVKMILV